MLVEDVTIREWAAWGEGEDEVAVTFRGMPVCEELVFLARRLIRDVPLEQRRACCVELSPLARDPGGARVLLQCVSSSGPVRVECRGNPFLAMREAFEVLARRPLRRSRAPAPA